MGLEEMVGVFPGWRPAPPAQDTHRSLLLGQTLPYILARTPTTTARPEQALENMGPVHPPELRPSSQGSWVLWAPSRANRVCRLPHHPPPSLSPQSPTTPPTQPRPSWAPQRVPQALITPSLSDALLRTTLTAELGCCHPHPCLSLSPICTWLTVSLPGA